jgi:CubicO group peptidase (beta-lactamase class C family)
MAGFSGVVLVGDATSLRYEKSLGLADRERKLANSADLPWRWASVSKQLTALIAAQLVAEGKLALDAHVADYLTAAQFPSVNAGRITIRQLLQHTSGLPNPSEGESADMPIPPFYRAAAEAATVHSASSRGLCAGAPTRPPGERFEYNNCDYLLLGAIIEQISGQPYAKEATARLLAPLKLDSVFLAGAAGSEQRTQPVKGYDDDIRAEPPLNLAVYGAAGGWLGTPRDLLKLDQAMLGDAVLSAAMKRQFWAGNPKLGYVALGVWSFPARLKGCPDPVELIERRGEIGDIQVRNILAPKSSMAIVVFTNRGDWEFGEIWQGKGFSHDLLSAALCPAATVAAP